MDPNSCDIATPEVDQLLAETVNAEQDDVGFGDCTILHVPDSVLQSNDATGCYKAAATEIPVEDASYPKATKADFANLENSLGLTAYQSDLESNDDQGTTKFIPDAISDASAGDFESCDHKLGVVPEWDPNSCDIATPEFDQAETRVEKSTEAFQEHKLVVFLFLRLLIPNGNHFTK